MTEKTAMEQKFQEGYDPEEEYLDDQEDIDDCDYGLTDGNGCFNPHLKHRNCCFECELQLEGSKAEEQP